MRRAVLAVLAVVWAACGNRTATGPTQSVVALAGPTVAEGGATVISHRIDGTQLDEEVADATGTAQVVIEPGAYVSVVFPALIAPLPTVISVVTVPATADGSQLVIHGPKHAQVPIDVARLTVDGPALAGATAYTVDLGCNTQAASALPADVAVIAPCEGTDINLDVLLRAYDVPDPASQTLLGYGAGRVPIGMDEAGDAIAAFTVDAWATTGTMVPVTETGVTADVALELVSDTLVYDTPAIAGGQAEVWDGLVVDSSIAIATMAGQVTTQYAPGTPTVIALGAADFLGSLAPGLSASDRSTLALDWADLEDSAVGGADAFDLRVAWTSSAQITWDAVLPVDSTQIAFPQFDPQTQQTIALPSASDAVTATFTAIDSSDLADFDDVLAAGIFAATGIVPAPATGEVRTSAATGPL